MRTGVATCNGKEIEGRFSSVLPTENKDNLRSRIYGAGSRRPQKWSKRCKRTPSSTDTKGSEPADEETKSAIIKGNAE